MSSYAGGVEVIHPRFPLDSEASFTIDDARLKTTQREDIKDIIYTPEDDEVIMAFVKANVGPMSHSLGTCAIASRDKGGVVNGKLDVYGATGLKIADMSIAPKIVEANTDSTALLVGEKAVDIVKKMLSIV